MKTIKKSINLPVELVGLLEKECKEKYLDFSHLIREIILAHYACKREESKVEMSKSMGVEK